MNIELYATPLMPKWTCGCQFVPEAIVENRSPPCENLTQVHNPILTNSNWFSATTESTFKVMWRAEHWSFQQIASNFMLHLLCLKLTHGCFRHLQQGLINEELSNKELIWSADLEGPSLWGCQRPKILFRAWNIFSEDNGKCDLFFF